MTEELKEEGKEMVETRPCSLCEKQIEVAKIRLHEMGCARMNYKCRECGEIVPKAEREQHAEVCGKPDITCDQCDEYVSKIAEDVAQHKRVGCKNIPVAQPNPAPQVAAA